MPNGNYCGRFGSVPFMIGAILSVLGGCCKVAWKLVLGLRKRDLRWLNKPFVPLMAVGFFMIIGSLIAGWKKISWVGIGKISLKMMMPIPTGQPRLCMRLVKPACCWALSLPEKQNEQTPDGSPGCFLVYLRNSKEYTNITKLYPKFV